MNSLSLRWAAGVLALTVPAVIVAPAAAVPRREEGARVRGDHPPHRRRPAGLLGERAPRALRRGVPADPGGQDHRLHVDLQDPALRAGEGALQGRRRERVLLQRGEVRRLRRREPLPAARRGVRRLHHRADPGARVGARGAGPGRTERAHDRAGAAGRLLRGRVGAQHRRRGVDEAQPERREPRHRPRRLPHVPRSTRERPDRRRRARQRLRPRRARSRRATTPAPSAAPPSRPIRPRSPTSRSPTRATSTAGETCPTARSSRPPPRTSTPTGRAS